MRLPRALRVSAGSISDGLREGEQPYLVWIPSGSALNISINSNRVRARFVWRAGQRRHDESEKK